MGRHSRNSALQVAGFYNLYGRIPLPIIQPTLAITVGCARVQLWSKQEGQGKQLRDQHSYSLRPHLLMLSFLSVFSKKAFPTPTSIYASVNSVKWS